MATLNVPIFEPSESEFADMASLLKKIETDTQCVAVGIAKVSCFFLHFTYIYFLYFFVIDFGVF